MKYILFFTLTSLLWLPSCKKKTPITHVSGVVINAGSKQPVLGAMVVMQDGVGSSGGWVNTGNSKTVGTGATQQVTTGADGTYSFSFKGEAPVIWVEKEQYRFYNPAGGNEIYFLTPGKTYSDLKLTLVAYAWFNPVLKGYNCLNSDSVLVFNDCSTLPPIRKWGGVFYLSWKWSN